MLKIAKNLNYAKKSKRSSRTKMIKSTCSMSSNVCEDLGSLKSWRAWNQNQNLNTRNQWSSLKTNQVAVENLRLKADIGVIAIFPQEPVLTVGRSVVFVVQDDRIDGQDGGTQWVRCRFGCPRCRPAKVMFYCGYSHLRYTYIRGHEGLICNIMLLAIVPLALQKPNVWGPRDRAESSWCQFEWL